MLVLSRKNRESVVVGGSDGFGRLLKVTVLDIRGGQVRLGFEVDRDVPVHRSEVWERIQAGQAEVGSRVRGVESLASSGGSIDRCAHWLRHQPRWMRPRLGLA